MRRLIVVGVAAISMCPGTLWAQSAEAEETAPHEAVQPQSPPRLTRARILTSAGLLIGGAALIANGVSNHTVPRDDRRMSLLAGVGAASAGGLVLAFPPRATADEPPPVEDDDDGEPGRTIRWTGIGLTIGGGVLLLQSYVVAENSSCSPNRPGCNDAARIYGLTGGVLTATGVTLVLMDSIAHRRGARVALGIAPRAVRLNLSF